MLGDILKIITSLETVNLNEDERFNATGEKYLVVGEHDNKMGVVDEYGKVKELEKPISFSITGDRGEVVIKGKDNDLRIKYGRATITDTGDVETTHEIFYDEPFPTHCQSLLVTQNANDQMVGFMAR